MIFKRHNGQHGRQASSAHSHSLAGRQPLRQRYKEIRLDPRLLRIAAPMCLANAPAGQNDLIPRPIARIIRAFDGAGKINSWYMRINADQTTARTDAQAVLVIHGGIVNRHSHIARG